MDISSILNIFSSETPKPIVSLSAGGHSIMLPEEWRKALRKKGVPLSVFLNQALVAEGDEKKLYEVTKKFMEQYKRVTDKIKVQSELYKQALSAMAYYEEFERTGEVPNRGMRPPEWKAQVKISDIIVDTLYKKNISDVGAPNLSYDMHAGLEELGNCLITCLYYVCIARRLGMSAEMYVVPAHAIVGLRFGRNVHFVDPTNNIKHVERERYLFKLKGGKKVVLDCRYPKRVDCYGLALAFSNKGARLLAEGKREDALEAFNTAIKLDPNCASAWINKGKLFLSRDTPNNNLNALEALKKAVDAHPENAEAWYEKGVAHHKLSMEDDALKAFKKSIELNPDNARAWNNAGYLLFKQGDVASALNYYENARKLEPENPTVWQNKGDAFFRLGKYKYARKAHKKALLLQKRKNKENGIKRNKKLTGSS